MRCYSHLSDDEREQIGLAKALGNTDDAIAQEGRPKWTISRELSRNKLPSGRYSPLHAAGAYQMRRRREALIERDRALRSFVVYRLAEGWTPEQISGWLKGGMLAVFARIEPELRKSINFDNDNAFAQGRLRLRCSDRLETLQQSLCLYHASGSYVGAN